MFGFNVTPAGLFVDPRLPFLATTPVGHIGSDSIIEIKCTLSMKDFTQDAYKEKKLKFLINKSGNLALKILKLNIKIILNVMMISGLIK